VNQQQAYVRIEHVTKRFDDFVAVDDVSLDVQRGEIFCLLGGSGSGKTTLLRMLAGFETPSAGRILVDGRDMSTVPPYERPVNMMFQSYALFPHMNVTRNIAFGLEQEHLGKDEIRRRVGEILDIVKMGSFAHRKPHQLSGGQRQRIALARALVKRPKLLLLDEPLISLDPHHQRTVVELTRTLQQQLGIAVLFTAHEINPLLGALDRVLYLGSGQAALGAVEEVITGPVLSRLYGSEIDVVRVNGRIFVMSGGYDVEHDAHQHDHNEHHVHV
jgi:putrescine transport system ATP-binding protein